jgi:hypothetical protein
MIHNMGLAAGIYTELDCRVAEYASRKIVNLETCIECFCTELQ